MTDDTTGTHADPGARTPLVSVVIPTYDRPAFFRDAVESVGNQSYDPIELVVVDDGSDRPAQRLLADVSLAPFADVQCLRHESNRGANAARTTGIRAASGEFVAFLDDDDLWEPRKIERQVAAFRTSPDSVGVVYTGQRYVTDDGTTTAVHEPTTSGTVTKDLLRGAALSPFSSVMVRAEVIPEAGPPDERFPCWQDREWYLRLSQACAFEAIPEPLVVRRMHDDGQISDDFERKRDVAYPLLLEESLPIATQYGRRYERKLVASVSQTLAVSGLQNGHYLDAVYYLLVSLWYDVFDLKSYLYLLVALGGKYTYVPAVTLKRTLRERDVT